MRRVWAIAVLLATTAILSEQRGAAQQSGALAVRAQSAGDLRTWDSYIDAGRSSGALRMRTAERDPAIPARIVERFDQFHAGVPIWGADMVRDSDLGVPQSIFGALAPELDLAVRPTLTSEQAEAAVRASGGDAATLLRRAQLVILPLESGEHRLAYTAVVSSDSGVDRVFVDAHAGTELLRYSEIQTQAAVGTGRGVLGDTKKLSVVGEGGSFWADDQHRPPVLRTYDLRGDLARLLNVRAGGPLFASDRASDADNAWVDGAAVDAHAHIGWTYDYYFKRHGRNGLDNRDRPLITLINGLTQQGALTAPPSAGIYVANASWCGSCGPGGIGVMYFGSGVPPGYYSNATGNNYTYFSGALDIAAHELTHGVIDSSSRLIYLNQSGALNESFADIIGTSVEFFFHPAGSGPGRADYTLGEDISRAVRPGAIDGDRSLANPALYGDPDHYSRRYTGAEDGGGVHINSGISNHAFYLAIEGGTNRTSGLAVQGVGAANREQIEKVFYRAFVFLLPSNATFAMARATTIQAARDLYGVGGAPERAVTQAWTAVGVF